MEYRPPWCRRAQAHEQYTAVCERNAIRFRILQGLGCRARGGQATPVQVQARVLTNERILLSRAARRVQSRVVARLAARLRRLRPPSSLVGGYGVRLPKSGSRHS